MARDDRRPEIIRAALQEVSAAGPDELFQFLTPARLADGTRHANRTWSAGTVRYHFRRDGLVFDRGQLASEVLNAALEEVRALLNDWLSELESRLRVTSPEDTESELCQGLEALGPVVQSASASLRAVILAGSMVGDTASARSLRDAVGGVASGVGGHLVEAYARSLRVPSPGSTLAAELGLNVLAQALGAHWLSDGGPRAQTLERVASSLSMALDDREAVASQQGTSAGEPETADEVVSRIERRLHGVDLASPAALTMLEELSSVLPTSSWAFARGRQLLETMLETPGIRRSDAGQRVWSVAAEVVGMATGNRALAEEAAAGAQRGFKRRGREDLLASIRTSWLLLRLERFEEARAELERIGHAARRSRLPEVSSLADAFIGYGAALDGPLTLAVEGAERIAAQHPDAPDAGFALPLAAAAAGRALLLLGDNEAASIWLQSPANSGVPRSMGQTMLEISRSWLLLAAGDDSEALGLLVTVRERLERLHVTNPAGWPWLEPSVIALHRLGRSAQAQDLIERASPHAERWGTPIVLAEVARSRASIAASPRERDQHLAQALRLLETAPGQVERDRTRLMLELSAGSAAEDRDVRAASILVQAPIQALADRRMTPRVHAVAELVAEGLRNQDIADILHLAPATVRQHVSAAMRATGTSTRTELALVMTKRSRP